MDYRVERLEAPLPVVSIQEAKEHLRVDADVDDALIQRYIAAAQDYIEGPYGYGVLLGTQRWVAYFQGFSTFMYLPLYPVQSIVELRYVDLAGDTQTFASFRADLIGNPSRLVPAPGAYWPATDPREPNAVSVEFEGGYEVVPEDLRQAVLLLVAHMYEMRQPYIPSGSLTKVPMAIEAILGKYAVLGVG